MLGTMRVFLASGGVIEVPANLSTFDEVSGILTGKDGEKKTLFCGNDEGEPFYGLLTFVGSVSAVEWHPVEDGVVTLARPWLEQAALPALEAVLGASEGTVAQRLEALVNEALRRLPWGVG